ncbi:MAG: hypothetical protein ICV87_07670, partial [Gemmatimonadetes bacterium]|nr:hypothetical protein [Gemmatimonadota bacterium]
QELLRALTSDDRFSDRGVYEMAGSHVHWIKYRDRAAVYGNTEEEMVRKAFRLYKPARQDTDRLERSA